MSRYAFKVSARKSLRRQNSKRDTWNNAWNNARAAMAKTDVRGSKTQTIFILLLVAALVLSSSYFIKSGLTGFAVFSSDSESSFGHGTYENTEWSGGSVQLQQSATSGSYSSQIFDAGTDALWQNINWTSSAYGELPDNGQSESFASGSANMQGNVLLMHMDEEEGQITDSSGQEHHGTYTGSSYLQTGKFNKSLGFDGNDAVSLGNVLNPGSSDWTVCLWFNWDGSSSDKILWNKENLYEARVSNGYVHYAWQPHWAWDGGSSFSVEANQWYFACVKYDHTKQYLYKNGNLVYSRSQTGNIGSNNNPFCIGARGTSCTNYPFKGKIDEFFVFNRALSDTEIMNLYKRGAEKLSLKVRGCDDAECAEDEWISKNSNSPVTLNITSRYFQYKFEFQSDSAGYSPKLYSVDVNYAVLNTAPSIVINFPANMSSKEGSSMLLNFTVYDNESSLNLSLYGDGVLINTYSNVSSGATITYNWTGLEESTHSWTVIASDGHVNTTKTVQFSTGAGPSIQNITATENITSGMQTTITAKISDSSSISSAWAVINSSTGQSETCTLNLNNEGYYECRIEAGPAGLSTYKIFANDTYGFSNSKSSSFNVSKPSAYPGNEKFPSEADPLSTITITAELNASSPIKGLKATINLPSDLVVIESGSYTKMQQLGNFTSGETASARWHVSTSSDEETYTFNITWEDAYGNKWKGNNKKLSVASSKDRIVIDTADTPEIESGKSYKMDILVKDTEGNYVDADKVYVTIKSSTGATVLGPVSYSTSGEHVSTGKYTFTYKTSASQQTGYWKTIINVTKGSNSYETMSVWRLTGGPFDVRNISIGDASIDSMKITATVENTGSANQDLTIIWNLTRIDNGKMLDSGADTIMVPAESSRTYSFSPQTDYIGKVKITVEGYYSGTEKAGAYKIFSTKQQSDAESSPDSLGTEKEDKTGESANKREPYDSDKSSSQNMGKMEKGKNGESQNISQNLRSSPSEKTTFASRIKANSQTWSLIGGCIAFVIITVALLIRQRELKKQVSEMKKQAIKVRTKDDIKKDISRIKTELAGLEEMHKDNMFSEKEYEDKKTKLKEKLSALQRELKS